MKFDVIIIGAGPIGLHSAFQAGMLGMNSAIIDTLNFIGGQCCALYPQKPIYDIPGYLSISGKNLIMNLYKQSSQFDPKYYLGETVIELKFIDNHFFLKTSKNSKLIGKIILIAAGAGCFEPNKPKIKDIFLYENKTVFYSIQDIKKFSGKNVLIIGGGDTAVDWAIQLSEISNKVFLMHRREKFTACYSSLKIMKELNRCKKIDLITGYQLNMLIGNNGILSKVIISSLHEEMKRCLEVDILLPFFGLVQKLGPITTFGLELKNNYIQVNYPYCTTNIPGVYAVGDIATYKGKLKLILTGFAESISALHHSYSRVFNGLKLHFQHSTLKGINGM